MPIVEAWYIDANLRGMGHGAQVIRTAERWAIENSYNELASDTELANTDSIAAHRALGFREVDRIVCFIKDLDQINPASVNSD